MIENIKLNTKIWNWKWQTMWEWDDKVSVWLLLSRLERWFYTTKKVEIDLSVIDLASYWFDCDDLFEFMTHYKIVENADLKYPVIINKKWVIIDGRHRLCKAILKWNKKLKWIMILDDNVI